jgi:hypothetical protein
MIELKEKYFEKVSGVVVNVLGRLISSRERIEPEYSRQKSRVLRQYDAYLAGQRKKYQSMV